MFFSNFAPHFAGMLSSSHLPVTVSNSCNIRSVLSSSHLAVIISNSCNIGSVLLFPPTPLRILSSSLLSIFAASSSNGGFRSQVGGGANVGASVLESGGGTTFGDGG